MSAQWFTYNETLPVVWFVMTMFSPRSSTAMANGFGLLLEVIEVRVGVIADAVQGVATEVRCALPTVERAVRALTSIQCSVASPRTGKNRRPTVFGFAPVKLPRRRSPS